MSRTLWETDPIRAIPEEEKMQNFPEDAIDSGKSTHKLLTCEAGVESMAIMPPNSQEAFAAAATSANFFKGGRREVGGQRIKSFDKIIEKKLTWLLDLLHTSTRDDVKGHYMLCTSDPEY